MNIGLELFRVEIENIGSKKFNSLITKMKATKHYSKEIKDDIEKHHLKIFSIVDYIQNRELVVEIVEYLRGNKKAKIYLADVAMSKYLIDFTLFDKRIQEYCKEYFGFDSSPYVDKKEVAHNIFTIDEYDACKYVFYPPSWGVYFAFADNYYQKPYFCECQKKSIENFYKQFNGVELKRELNKAFPMEILRYLKNEESILRSFQFKKNVCHKCNKVMPKYYTRSPMYSNTKFQEKCNPYIYQKIIEYGYKYSLSLDGILPLIPGQFNLEDIKNIDTLKELEDFFEDLVRLEFGINKKGERWIGETYMFQLVEYLFPDRKLKKHARPEWLEGLELDLYLPEFKIGFEYNGQQHYRAVEFFGGEKSLKKQKINDKRKQELCKKNDVILIEIKYDENLSLDLIKGKLLEKGISYTDIIDKAYQ